MVLNYYLFNAGIRGHLPPRNRFLSKHSSLRRGAGDLSGTLSAAQVHGFFRVHIMRSCLVTAVLKAHDLDVRSLLKDAVAHQNYQKGCVESGPIPKPLPPRIDDTIPLGVGKLGVTH